MDHRIFESPEGLNVRMPPQAVESEQGLLGALLMTGGLGAHGMDAIAGLIDAADFYRDDHRKIFNQIVKLTSRRMPADVVTVADALSLANQSEQTGGLGYLGELANRVGSAQGVVAYAKTVHDRAVRRRLIEVADLIAGAAYGPQPLEEILAEADQLITGLQQGGSDEIIDAPTIAAQMFAKLEQAPSYLKTGFTQLDKQLGGVEDGDLVVIAGRPGMGKTALAVNMADRAAKRGERTAIFSLEMRQDQLMQRIVAARSGVFANRMRQRTLTPEELDKIADEVARMERDFFILNAARTVPQIVARCRQLHRQSGGKLRLAAIDYVQIVDAPEQKKSNDARYLEIGVMTRALKAVAVELGIVVVVLSQLSRKVEERQDKRPMMSDLRESGSIEQDADIIMMLYRDEYYNPKTTASNEAEVIVAKHRNGETGTIRLYWDPKITRFDDLGSPGAVPFEKR
jgi:replicative DNA helicase